MLLIGEAQKRPAKAKMANSSCKAIQASEVVESAGLCSSKYINKYLKLQPK